MKNKLVLYLLVSLVASCIYPVTVWAKVNERFSLKTRSILIPPCSVALLESSLIFSFHSLSEDAEIILYNSANSEMLRIPISRYQRGSEMNIPIDYLEMGSYTLEIVTASGEHWYGYFEYVASDTLSL